MQIKKIEGRRDDQLKGISDLRNWLDLALKQNQGLFKVHGKELIYDQKSLNLFSHQNRFRNLIVWITEWKVFDNIVIAFIILGSACQVL